MTLAQMVRYVQERLTIHSSDTDMETQIVTALNAARDKLVAQERLLVTRGDVTFTAGSSSVTLPAGVMEILSISTGEFILEPVTYNELADYEVRGITSVGPLAYLRDGSTTSVEVWPDPQTTVTVTNGLTYVPQPTELSGASDTPSEVPRAYHDLICEMAIIPIAQSEEAFDISQQAIRNVYGTPGTTHEGKLKEFRDHMQRAPGVGATRIWAKGYR